MNKTKLSPYDWDMCAMIESITGKSVHVDFFPEFIRLSWEQSKEDGETVGENKKIKALQQAIEGRLNKRVVKFEFKNGLQMVYFEYDPTEYPMEIRFDLMKPTEVPETRYQGNEKEVDAVLFVRDNMERVNAFTGGGTLTVPSEINREDENTDMRATFFFPNEMGLLLTVYELEYIVKDNGKYSTRSQKDFESEYKRKY